MDNNFKFSGSEKNVKTKNNFDDETAAISTSLEENIANIEDKDDVQETTYKDFLIENKPRRVVTSRKVMNHGIDS